MERPGTERSLRAMAWIHLRGDPKAVLGSSVIALALLVALFGRWIRPDHTAWADDQMLGIKDQPPGFACEILTVPATTVAGTAERIPVHHWAVELGDLVVETFNGHNDLVPGEQRVFGLQDVASGMLLDATDTAFATFVRKHFIERRHFVLGTDSFGRDVLSRLMAGTSISLGVGLIAVLIALLIGIPLGATAGYFRAEAPTFRVFGRTFRWPVDDVIMWLVNVVWSVPTLLMVIAITLALGKGFVQVFFAVGLTMWVEVARVVRGEVVRVREMEFVEAAKALGYSPGRIIFHHILPNVMGPVIVISAANFATAILMEAGLSFLGIGAQLPMVSWGGMIRSYYPYITTSLPHLALLPGLCIMVLTLAFMLVGNGLRDALDTRSITGR
ncbi:MAG: ABC transporter permease [Flavobacteriales bacterium]|nr:ABC transporter permease [Flavobacteriales bacterium]MCB9192909.1 ABC transporter permease [Flavobacteriales bacterium]